MRLRVLAIPLRSWINLGNVPALAKSFPTLAAAAAGMSSRAATRTRLLLAVVVSTRVASQVGEGAVVVVQVRVVSGRCSPVSSKRLLRT